MIGQHGANGVEETAEPQFGDLIPQVLQGFQFDMLLGLLAKCLGGQCELAGPGTLPTGAPAFGVSKRPKPIFLE
jgi:hypothetical protein